MLKIILQGKVTMQLKVKLFLTMLQGWLWIEMGWPGSLQYNQVWSNSEIYLCKDKYFNHKDYLLGNVNLQSKNAVVN